MEPAQALTAALAHICGSGRAQVQEDGKWLPLLAQFQYEVRDQQGVLLLHLWSGECNLVRRVLRIQDQTDTCLALEVSSFSRARAGRLEFRIPELERPSGKVAREQFCARFRQLLTLQFPDEKIASLVTAADLAHSLSGNYARGVLVSGTRAWAVLAAAPDESSVTYDGLLTFGLLWLHRVRESARRPTVQGVRLFFPEGAGRVTAHRLQALSRRAAVEIYEYSDDTGRMRRLDANDIGNVETWLTPRRDAEATLAQASLAIEKITRLAPAMIDVEPVAGATEVVFRYRGLVFARWQDGNTFYGIGDPREPLTAEREPQLTRLIRDLETYRSPVATNRKHPLYRAQPERWLQTLVAADPTRVDARLDPRFLYSQVPAFSAADRGVMDLLGVTRNARLAVIELKASEDIQLVLQGVDYWLRVRWHHAQQDFSRYGYFPGITLDARPPILILMGPSLHFHPTAEILLPYLIPEIEIWRVGVTEDWRRGLKVVLRQTRDYRA